MAKFYRLKVPAFDLHWYESSPEVGKDSQTSNTASQQFLLLPGGGGSMKSGVKNQIMIAQFLQEEEKKSTDDIVFLDSHLTDTDKLMALCNGVTSGHILDKNVICALVDRNIQVLEVLHDDKKFSLKKITEFQAEFDGEHPSLNVSMVTSSGAIVSGGDDNKVRVWAVTNKGEDEEWKFVKAHELSLHTAPISCIVEHPSKPWICCAGKDGRCVIWDYTDGSLVVDIPCMVDGIAGSGSTGATVKMECRGCAFSSDGEFLYSIQSARKGSTYLIKWSIEKKNKDGKTTFQANPVKVTIPGKVPSTRMSISKDGNHLAVGGSDGKVTVVSTETLRAVQSFVCHDLPVTGLDFAPTKLTHDQGLEVLLASCSADNKISILRVYKSSSLLKMFLLFIILLAIALLSLATFGLNDQVSATLAKLIK